MTDAQYFQQQQPQFQENLNQEPLHFVKIPFVQYGVTLDSLKRSENEVRTNFQDHSNNNNSFEFKKPSSVHLNQNNNNNTQNDAQKEEMKKIINSDLPPSSSIHKFSKVFVKKN